MHALVLGYVDAVKRASAGIIQWTEFFSMVTSICTDGENLNTGEKSSLWALLDEESMLSASFGDELLYAY